MFKLEEIKQVWRRGEQGGMIEEQKDRESDEDEVFGK